MSAVGQASQQVLMGLAFARFLSFRGRDGGGDLRGHHLQDSLILVCERVSLVAPDANGTDNASPDDERTDESCLDVGTNLILSVFGVNLRRRSLFGAFATTAQCGTSGASLSDGESRYVGDFLTFGRQVPDRDKLITLQKTQYNHRRVHHSQRLA